MSDIDVLLEVDPVLAGVATREAAFEQSIKDSVSARLREVAQALGIPGGVAVRVAGTSTAAVHPGSILRLRVNGWRCAFPSEMLFRGHSYMTNGLMTPRLGMEALREWLVTDGDSAETGDGSGRGRLPDFLGIVCAEAVKQRASVLMGPDQATAYASGVPELPSDANAVRAILGGVLDLGISVADAEMVSRVLRERGNASAHTLGEQLVAALRPQVLEVQMASESLKALTVAHVGSAPQSFSFLRDGMFVETGVRYPAFRFTAVDHLQPRQFAFKINHLTTLPWVGLDPGQCLVNDTVTRLALLNVKGTPTRSPVTRSEQAIADLADQPVLVKAGLTTWNDLEFVILCFAATLRAHGGRFVDNASVERDVRALAMAFPALVDAVRASMPHEHITDVLRSLVREGVPVRNLRAVLERLVDYGLSNGQRPDDVGEIVSFVRSGIRGKSPTGTRRAPRPSSRTCSTTQSRTASAGWRPATALRNRLATGLSTRFEPSSTSCRGQQGCPSC